MRSEHRFIGITWELASLVWTGEDEDGFPVASYDGQGPTAGGIAGTVEHFFGFASKPLDPETDPNGRQIPGRSCNVLVGKLGKETLLFHCTDPRVIPKLPVLKKGGAIFYCAHGSFRVFDGDDGTETAYFPVPGDKAHIATTGLDGQGRPVVAFEHCDGMSITMLEHSLVLKNAAGDCYIELKDGQMVFNGNEVHNGGATFGDPVNAKPAAIAPAVIAVFAAIEDALAKLALAIDGKTPPSPGTTVGVIAQAVGSMQGLHAAVAALKTSIA